MTAPGIKAYRKIQGGIETTAGTEVNADTVLRVLGVPDDQSKHNNVEEDVGYVSGVNRTYISSVLGGFDFESSPCTFEQLPFILTCGVQSCITGVADGLGTGRIYTYGFPTTAAKTIDTATLEGGDDAGEEQMTNAFVKSFSLTGKSQEALMYQSTWQGRQLAPGTFTSITTIPTVNSIMFNKGKLYIDDAGGTIGTTQVSKSLLSIDLSVDTGWIPVFSADGELFFSFIKHTREAMNIVTKLTFEHDAKAISEKATWRSETPRKIRLKWEGKALTTAGTLYPNYALIIDMAGKWESFDKIGESDGNDTVMGTFRAQYDPVAALFASIIVVNELAGI